MFWGSDIWDTAVSGTGDEGAGRTARRSPGHPAGVGYYILPFQCISCNLRGETERTSPVPAKAPGWSRQQKQVSVCRRTGETDQPMRAETVLGAAGYTAGAGEGERGERISFRCGTVQAVAYIFIQTFIRFRLRDRIRPADAHYSFLQRDRDLLPAESRTAGVPAVLPGNRFTAVSAGYAERGPKPIAKQIPKPFVKSIYEHLYARNPPRQQTGIVFTKVFSGNLRRRGYAEQNNNENKKEQAS